MSLDEGPAYTGKGGMGLASGTKNTYVIEGMDEMSPEEYREALQGSISARQDKRRETGTFGNMSSENYLSAIGWGGATAALSGKAGTDGEKKSITDEWEKLSKTIAGK